MRWRTGVVVLPAFNMTAKVALVLLVGAATIVCSNSEAPDCLEMSERRLVTKSENIFDSVGSILDVTDARITDFNPVTKAAEVAVVWSNGDKMEEKTKAYLQTLRLDERNNVVQRSDLNLLSNVIFLDGTEDKSRSAFITSDDSEFYLTVNTDSDATSCTLRLSFHTNFGPPVSGRVFGSFRFSPDGRYIMYMAEEDPAEHHEDRFVYQTVFKDSPPIKRPVIILYDVDNVSFRKVPVPDGLTPGNLQWHPQDGHFIVGVVWNNTKYHLLYPDSTNTETRLFAIDLSKNDAFYYLTGGRHHYYAPRFSPDGLNLVYLENCLHSSTVPMFFPGPYMMSSRLKFIQWMDFLEYTRSGRAIPKQTLIGNSQSRTQHPIILSNGDTFYGLYPVLDPPIPDNIFSADGRTVYYTTNQLASTRILAINIESKQLLMHPKKDIRLLDSQHDILLVYEGNTLKSPHVSIGRVDFHSVTTTTTPHPSTTLDPCEHLLQELEIANIDRNNTIFNLDNADETVIIPPGLHRTHLPPPLAETTLSNITAFQEMQVSSSFHLFDNPRYKGGILWTADGSDNSFFNAWYAKPRHVHGDLPLFVHLKGGPHSVRTQAFSRGVQMILQMGMAFLTVNHRGSTGMGDETLQAIAGNIGMMGVEDSHQAIQRVLATHPELSGQVVVHGLSFGGHLATHLAAKYPGMYKVLVLENPMVDFSVVRSSAQFLAGLFGRNFSDLFLPDQAYLGETWQRSSLRLADYSRASTLFFLGEEDQAIVPEVQGLSLHRAMRMRGRNTSARILVGQGHEIQGYKEWKYIFVNTMKWAFSYLGLLAEECQQTTATWHVPSDGSGTTSLPTLPTNSDGTTTKPSMTSTTSTTKRPPISAAAVTASGTNRVVLSISVLCSVYVLTACTKCWSFFSVAR